MKLLLLQNWSKLISEVLTTTSIIIVLLGHISVINTLLDANADRKLGESPFIYMNTKILNTSMIANLERVNIVAYWNIIIQSWIPGFINLEKMSCVTPYISEWYLVSSQHSKLNRLWVCPYHYGQKAEGQKCMGQPRLLLTQQCVCVCVGGWSIWWNNCMFTAMPSLINDHNQATS